MGALIAVAIIVLLVVAAGAWYYSRQQRTKGLKENFGPEYERALRQSDRDKGQAEGELEERRKRVEQLNLRDLNAGRAAPVLRQVAKHAGPLRG